MQNLEDAGNLSYGATGTTAPTLVPGVGDAQRGGAGAIAAAARAGPGDDVRRVRGLGRVGVRREPIRIHPARRGGVVW